MKRVNDQSTFHALLAPHKLQLDSPPSTKKNL